MSARAAGLVSMIEFFVDGEPAPQGSKRAFRHAATGKIIMVESSAKVRPWRALVAHAASEAMAGRPMEMGPVRMIATYYFCRPKAHYNSKGQRKPTAPEFVAKKPDLSKLQRSTEDALTGIVYRDDSQIVALTIAKRFIAVDDKPGAHIEVIPLPHLAAI